MKTKLIFLILSCILSLEIYAQSEFSGLQVDMSNLFMLSNAKSRSISPENFTGEKGKGGMAKIEDKDIPNTANAWRQAEDLGQGWKVNPYI